MGPWEAKGKLCLHLIQKNHWVKRQSILLPTREGHLWEQCDKCPRKDIFCQMEELCKCMAPKALSDVFVFQMCNKSFNAPHTAPLGNWDFSAGLVAWCIGREPFTAFCGDSALWPTEKPIVVNICGFGLLNSYSLFPGNRISTFFWEKPLPYSQSPSSKCTDPTSQLLGAGVTWAWSMSVCSLSGQGWSRDPSWAHEFNSGTFCCNCWGRETLGWAGTLWGCRPRVVGGHLVLTNEQLAGE